MIDTTTINYAMEKLNGVFEKVAPAAVDLSEKYVRFVVTRECITPVIGLVLLVVTAIVFKRYYSVEKFDSDNESEMIPQMLLLIFSGAAILGGTIITLSSCSDAILAILNPEMFTIHQLIKK